ncbi:hypothetical protein N7535_004468 [Penicillium sp. DV-2018c]|nr:hypothetical protein N7535_004468 [Penicillium sp. DV-2018c]
MNKQGKRNKTCKRHSLEIDDWGKFRRVLREWNKLTQTKILHGKYTFHLNALPVQFGCLRDNEDAFPRSELNAAMRDLYEIIWAEGGFRFTRGGTSREILTYRYHCFQDAMRTQRYKPSVEPGKRRDRIRMDGFPCESNLTMNPRLSTRTLTLSICHKRHASYQDIHVPKIVREMINKRLSTETQSEVFREV